MHSTMMCLKKIVMQGMALQALHVDTCVVHTLGRGGLGCGLQGGHLRCAAAETRVQVSGPLLSVPPSRKLACTSDGVHIKQHRAGLFYRAPTPDHTQRTAASHRTQAHREKAQQTAGPSWERPEVSAKVSQPV